MRNDDYAQHYHYAHHPSKETEIHFVESPSAEELFEKAYSGKNASHPKNAAKHTPSFRQISGSDPYQTPNDRAYGNTHDAVYDQGQPNFSDHSADGFLDQEWPNSASDFTYPNQQYFGNAFPYEETSYTANGSSYEEQPYSANVSSYGEQPYSANDIPYENTQYTTNGSSYGEQPYSAYGSSYGEQPYSTNGSSYGEQPYSTNDIHYEEAQYTANGSSYGEQPYSTNVSSYEEQPYSVNGSSYGEQPYSANGSSYGEQPYSTNGIPHENTQYTANGIPYEEAQYTSNGISYENQQYIGNDIPYEEAQYIANGVSYEEQPYSANGVPYEESQYTAESFSDQEQPYHAKTYSGRKSLSFEQQEGGKQSPSPEGTGDTFSPDASIAEVSEEGKRLKPAAHTEKLQKKPLLRRHKLTARPSKEKTPKESASGWKHIIWMLTCFALLGAMHWIGSDMVTTIRNAGFSSEQLQASIEHYTALAQKQQQTAISAKQQAQTTYSFPENEQYSDTDRSGLPDRYPDNPLTNVLPEVEAIRESNSDAVGRLTIEGLLEENVYQNETDPIYYLNYDEAQNASSRGAVYVNSTISFEKAPPEHIILHGSSDTDGVLAVLQNYVTGGITYAQSLSRAVLLTPYSEEAYVLFAVFDTDPTSENAFYSDNYVSFSSDRDMMNYVAEVKARSLYSFNVSVEPGDRLLTIATISGQGNSYVLVFRALRTGE